MLSHGAAAAFLLMAASLGVALGERNHRSTAFNGTS